MKKLIAMLLFVCLLPLCALSEMDEDGDVVVTLDGAEFFFTPIEDGYVLTRESSASVFNRLGLSQREMVPYMEEWNIHTLMYDAEVTCEVDIIAYESVETDLDEITEHGEVMLCADQERVLAEQGYDVISVDVYNALDGHKFIRSVMEYTYEDGYVDYIVEYLTIKAGYTVMIVLYTFDGPAAEAHMAMCEAIADSLWITSIN